jgi:hypothetical protein
MRTFHHKAMHMTKRTAIAPTEIRFIKLGEAGCWETDCIENGTLQLGFESKQHLQSLRGEWDAVYEYWREFRTSSRREATAKDDLRQIRTFYEAPMTMLWITFYKNRLYWCFAQPEVIELEDYTRIRRAIGAWSCNDLNDRPLETANLDGRVTAVQGYRGTICEIKNEVRDYLVNKINGVVSRDVVAAISNLAALNQSVRELVRGLHWKDFELLTDLIFARSGLQRVSVLGATTKDIDLELLAPVTGRRAFVQVKSQADQETLDECVRKFNGMNGYDDFFFVMHTGPNQVQRHQSDDQRINVIGPDRISELVINAGLTNWLIHRRS